MPWKNGGGITRELQLMPPGAGLDQFIWRASLAEVASDGPFSIFPGIERTLVLLDGAGFTLHFDTHHQRLDQALQPYEFDGEHAITARLLDGPTRDFNLMVRRDAAHAELAIVQGPGAWQFDARVTLLYCCQGSIELRHSNSATATLDAGDLLHIAPVEAGLWQGSASAAASLIVIRVTPHHAPHPTPHHSSGASL